jgi:hypothetical protein
LRVRKVGSVTTQLSFELSGGESRSGVTVQLRNGDGSISGFINGATGPLGAATITVTSPDQTASTLSLTTGLVGSFSLPDLLTPSSYAVAISSSGYATKNLTVSLASGQKITDLNVQLLPSTGSISGMIRDNYGNSLGGIPITITDGENSFTSVSVTVDDPTTPTINEIGSYSILGLSAPSVYTVTIGGGSYGPVVRNVALQSSNLNSTVSVELIAASGSVTGSVTEKLLSGNSGQALGSVTVRITNGITSRSTTTASVCSTANIQCVGTYRLENVPSGIYTITFTRTNYATYATQLLVVSGSGKTFDASLSIRPKIKVYVCKTSTSTTTTVVTTPSNCTNPYGLVPQVGYQVRIWKQSDYPGGTILGVDYTKEDGSVTFSGLEAPTRYIVAVTNIPGTPALTSQTIDLSASILETVVLLETP